VLVPLDGSSIKLWDGNGTKDFGRIGSHAQGATGLKMMNALFLSPEGCPLGLAGQVWWKRPLEKPSVHHEARALEEKETQYWFQLLDSVTSAAKRHAPKTRLWFQLDRGGDIWSLLQEMADGEHWFTVRSSFDRRLVGKKERLYSFMKRQPVAMYCELVVKGREGHKEHPDRKQRVARMAVRATRVELELRHKTKGRLYPTEVNVVQIREAKTTPRGEAPICWTLLTNHPIETNEDLRKIVHAYRQRWRIEEFHKTWKSGRCNIEDTQLRCSAAVIRWGTILAAVAARVERLKYLARNEPEQPASVELDEYELRVLRLLRKKYGPLRQRIPEHIDIATAVLWIAELGGYTGRSSGGPPGSITIGRGLEQIRIAAEVLRLTQEYEK
jgi:hypothetical protein